MAGGHGFDIGHNASQLAMARAGEEAEGAAGRRVGRCVVGVFGGAELAGALEGLQSGGHRGGPAVGGGPRERKEGRSGEEGRGGEGQGEAGAQAGQVGCKGAAGRRARRALSGHWEIVLRGAGVGRRLEGGEQGRSMLHDG